MFDLEDIQDMEDFYQGGCIACGFIQDGCEPDARGEVCENCNKHKVFGTYELTLGGYVS